jgi:hypothetical protein
MFSVNVSRISPIELSNQWWRGFLISYYYIVGEKLDQLQRTSGNTNKDLRTIQQKAHDDAIKDWLNPPDPTVNQVRARKLRHAGTGTWFLQSPAYEEWQSGQRRHIWLRALAGSGKTVLGTTILDHLQERAGLVVLSFYFDFTNKDKQSLNGMLRSLAFQLYRQQGGGSPASLSEAFREYGHGQPTSDVLSAAISQMCKTHERVVIVIDALDESTERHDLLAWIDETIHRPGPEEPSHVQFLFTGRPESEFISEFPALLGNENCLSLDEDAINADICAYVSSQLEANSKFTKRNLAWDIRDKIVRRVGKGAQGM